MKEVLGFIEAKKLELEQLPLLQFMKDKTIAPQKRLAWTPCLALFAMNFGDLNKYVLRQEPANSKIQEIINVHTYEDDHHWLWYLHDLNKLELDHSLKFSDALRFMWSSETQKARLVCHQLGLLFTLNTDPTLRLAISLSIEATGHVILYATSQVVKELVKTTNEHYIYFGESHFHVETGHPIGTENVEEFIHNTELTEENTNKACQLVEEVFAIFTDMFHQCLEYIEVSTPAQPYLTQKYQLSRLV